MSTEHEQLDAIRFRLIGEFTHSIEDRTDDAEMREICLAAFREAGVPMPTPAPRGEIVEPIL